MKPTDTIRLRDTLDRALSVRDLLIQPALRTAVGGTETLPSPPPVIIELRSAMSDRATDAARVAQIVEQDAALVAKLLQLANSAFFGSSRRYAAGTVVSIHEAVVILGLNVVEQLALVTGIFGAFDGQEKALGLSANDLRRHATLVADIASNFMTSRRYAEEAYFAGILHDVGKLVLASRFPAAYTRVVERHKRGEGSVADLETEQFGASHAEVGGFLLACWGLPRIVVEAVAYHHRPSVLGRTHFDAVGAVHIAEAMAQDFEEAIPIGTLELESRLDAVYMEASGANERMRAFREIAADVVRRN
jgi:HD-like signal output (HDOD) protein